MIVTANTAPSPRNQQTFEITHERGIPSLGLLELWGARGVLGFLVWRDVKVRYAQTALGIAWVIVQPLLTTLLFALLFGRLAHLPSDGVPYVAFALVGLIVWSAFASAVAGAGNSLIEQSHLLTKVYFPRLFLPLASVAVGVLDATVASVFLMPAVLFIAPPPGLGAVALAPLFVVLALITAIGAGAALSALNLRYRDFRYVIPFLLQAWMFASPIAYPASLVPAAYRALYAMNPLVGALEGCRWALLGTARPSLAVLVTSSASALATFVVGILYFRWSERTFVDVA
ncbi:MAG: ABC-type polysaccharide/polyol phosphate export system, permease component [Gemmatimonadetes bacterium]|nr:ABC-type polysaccharide/polyol phosphate export system, permease component [Gemmatimonadota bacterium]